MPRGGYRPGAGRKPKPRSDLDKAESLHRLLNSIWRDQARDLQQLSNRGYCVEAGWLLERMRKTEQEISDNWQTICFYRRERGGE